MVAGEHAAWQWGDTVDLAAPAADSNLAQQIWLGFKAIGKSEISARDAVFELYELTSRSVPLQRLTGFICGHLADPSDEELQIISVALTQASPDKTS